MKYIVVNDAGELNLHSQAIFLLFQESFGFSLDKRLWEWAYIENPNGNPVVALAYDDKKLVGHYAAIPFPLSNGKGECRNAFLSMTTMVHPEYRKYGLFVKLAEMSYDVLREKAADLVCGFPNSMSAPGFKKRLSWELDEPRHLIKTTKDILLKNISEIPVLTNSDGAFCLDIKRKKVKEWRFSKPGMSYDVKEGLVTKSFGDEIDVIFLESLEWLDRLPEGKNINILVPDSSLELKKFSYDTYLFGFIPLNMRSANDCFVQQMFMSDVF
ncbi:GNAT family N-acetyltransferase [Halomonas alimentaria]|uniref:GNAT family N-acetyltransferase n=1 Tax=Halomonas alimentaria TaxID=147248 RepID=UPI002491DB4D|nr:GNAT family N-acetyltransferase [Halomonas alimentaria]